MRTPLRSSSNASRNSNNDAVSLFRTTGTTGTTTTIFMVLIIAMAIALSTISSVESFVHYQPSQQIHNCRIKVVSNNNIGTHNSIMAVTTSRRQQKQQKQSSSSSTIVSSAVVLKSSSSNNNNDRFSREVRLREEAESPFRKVRYFLYLNIAGGATTSLLISIARIGAALSGVNTDLMDESLRNAAIDLAGLAGVAYFWKRDQEAEESRLKRATKGAELAKLNVRASKALLLGDDTNDDASTSTSTATFTTTLASFRRARGIEKRVVIAAAGKDKIQQVLREARALQDDLAANDLVVVPVVMPQGVAPQAILMDGGGDGDGLDATMNKWPTNVALPVTVGNNWKVLVEEEAAEATSQGVDIEEEGFCIILKKNGRVGQRTRGIFLNNLVGNVVARKEAGMDVQNI